MSKPYHQFGNPDQNTIEQMDAAMQLDIAVAGALMPDAHLGYGLPIGGVLACKDAVIPYGVGVDIACRVKLSVLDLDGFVGDLHDRFTDAIESETRFGAGAAFEKPREHEVLDDPDWEFVCSEVGLNMDIVRAQLGTSGGGNHFVDIGILTMHEAAGDIPVGTHFAILTHSGSRGAGHKTCTHYSRIAKEQRPEAGELAWLDMRTDAGMSYWLAMQLMGRYAHANHDVIHREIARKLGVEILGGIENHHNFAWQENDLFVHRKGATPAAEGELGVVPGTMMHAAHIIRGKGDPRGLNSSAHGAGRRMGRKQAKRELDHDAEQQRVREMGVTLLGAGSDEYPGAYKNIETVMSEQEGLAESIGTFQPRIVKMAG